MKINDHNVNKEKQKQLLMLLLGRFEMFLDYEISETELNEYIEENYFLTDIEMVHDDLLVSIEMERYNKEMEYNND